MAAAAGLCRTACASYRHDVRVRVQTGRGGALRDLPWSPHCMWQQGQSCGGRGLLLHRLCHSCMTRSTEKTVIDLSLTNSYAFLFHAQLFKVWSTIGYFPPRPPGLPALYQVDHKGRFKGWCMALVFALSS